MSWQARLAHWLLWLRFRRRSREMEAATPEAIAAEFSRMASSSRRWLPSPPRDLVVEATPRGEWLRLDGSKAVRSVFYCHGGGYFWGSPLDYRDFGWRLAQALEAEVFLLDYRLAPAHRCPAALDDSLSAWRALVADGLDPARTVMAGDSAGGGLALATLMALRDAGEPLPALACLISPWTDMTGAGASLRTRYRADPMLSPAGLQAAATLYCADEVPFDDWRASPLLGDHHGLPPTLIQVGGDEVLLSDSERLHARLAAAGVVSELRVWPGMYHVWHLGAAFVPEGRRAIGELAQFVARKMP
ncbi:alpha/beta hydrolase [Minwuia thermotolerans]|nr:alpha/beta hydrolase [Minwuia thermotolerans]